MVRFFCFLVAFLFLNVCCECSQAGEPDLKELLSDLNNSKLEETHGALVDKLYVMKYTEDDLTLLSSSIELLINRFKEIKDEYRKYELAIVIGRLGKRAEKAIPIFVACLEKEANIIASKSYATGCVSALNKIDPEWHKKNVLSDSARNRWVHPDQNR